MVSDLIRAEITDEQGTHPPPDARRMHAVRAPAVQRGITETVAKLLGNAAIVLAQHPSERATWSRTPRSFRTPSRSSSLRSASPVQGRWTTRAVSLHGVDIPQDSKVLLLRGAPT